MTHAGRLLNYSKSLNKILYKLFLIRQSFYFTSLHFIQCFSFLLRDIYKFIKDAVPTVMNCMLFQVNGSVIATIIDKTLAQLLFSLLKT